MKYTNLLKVNENLAWENIGFFFLSQNSPNLDSPSTCTIVATLDFGFKGFNKHPMSNDSVPTSQIQFLFINDTNKKVIQRI